VIPLSDRQLEDFQEAVAWETAMRLPDGRTLGRPGKRGSISEPGDFRVRALDARSNLSDKRVLELGCHEGIHTVQLAGVAKEVVGVEVRPKNVVGALTRLFVHDVRNARIVLEDVRDLDASFGSFDVLFHVGVLYHLLDPVEHLYRVAPLADAILLDTHYETPETTRERSDLTHEGHGYNAYLVREGGWADSFSGVESASRWLDRDSLLVLVGDVGFGQVEVLDDRRERNGPRITVLARRSAP
jgi:tRNA (mo5U34)-methyltransferase